jgi:hypothetical protein
MKRLLWTLLALVVLGLAGREVDADDDIRIGDGARQVEVTVSE